MGSQRRCAGVGQARASVGGAGFRTGLSRRLAGSSRPGWGAVEASQLGRGFGLSRNPRSTWPGWVCWDWAT